MQQGPTVGELIQIAFLLIQNGALLALGVMGYCQVRRLLRDRLPPRTELLLCGFVFGSLGILSIIGGIDAGNGVRLDLRNAMVAVVTMLGGLEAGTVATLVIIASRLAVGGGGVAGGILSLVTALGISALSLVALRRRAVPVTSGRLFAVGVLVAFSGLGVIVLFPHSDVVDQTLVGVTPSWLVLMPLTIAFLGRIIIHSERAQVLAGLLEDSEGRLRIIMDNAPFAIFLKDRAGRYQLVNRCYEELLRIPAESVLGRTNSEVFSADIDRASRDTDMDVLERGLVTHAERRPSSSISAKFLSIVKFPVRAESGGIVGVAGFISDISDRKDAEIALHASRELLLESQHLGRVGYFVSETGSDRVYLSDSLFEIRGIPRREHLNSAEMLDMLHPEDRPRYLALRRAALAESHDFTIDLRILRPDGSIGWEHCVNHPRFDETGKLRDILTVVRDITESRQADEALRSSEERFRALVEYSNDIVLVLTPAGTIIYRGPSRDPVDPYPEAELIGRLAVEFVHPDDRDAFASALAVVGERPGNHATGRLRVRRPRGDWTHADWSAQNATDVPSVTGIIINMHDTTKEQRLEEQLMQVRKMEAIGQLAGGIAHDFNNILGAILGFAGFLQQDLAKFTPQRRFADRVVTAALRARELVEQILTFSRRSSVERKPCDLVGIIRETRDLLQVSLPSSTGIEVLFAANSLVAEVNATEISQVLLNLCLNANDALAGNPGRISVTVSKVAFPTAEAAAHEVDRPTLLGVEDPGEARVTSGGLLPGREYARISVDDDGVGMDSAVLSRVFDPFFTTKDRGRGTGLGLAVAHGIVLAYDGAWVVTSTPGIGSSFTCYLPLTSKDLREDAIAACTVDLRGSERILVVDDEVDLTDVLTIALDRLGYEVVGVNDPIEALEVFAENPEAWDLVISDQVMPRMKGLVLLERLRILRPSLPFILCTGFSDGATEESARSVGADAFFMKPMVIDELAAAIRRLVERPSETRPPPLP